MVSEEVKQPEEAPWPHSIKRIRTIALVGQAGSGKTTLAEALLAKAGAVPAAGSVERGTTVCDYAPLEKAAAALAQARRRELRREGQWRATRIHLLDTPGYPDFLGHALPALAAVETAAIVINAQNGIEMMTGALHAVRAEARARPPDHRQQDRRRERRPARSCSSASRQAFGKECLPLNLPAARSQQGLGLLLRAFRRGRLLVGRGSAPRARRAGGRGRREADGEVPREGRGHARGAARAARAGAARGPSDPGRASRRRDRRRHRRAARRDRASCCRTRPRAIRPSTSSTPTGERRRHRAARRCPIRASTCSRTSSRSRSIPTSAASRCSACTRDA